MKFAKNKTSAIAIAIILIFSMTASMMLMPNVNAHTPPWTYNTWMYIAVTNNVLGVGQQEGLTFWQNNYPPTASGEFGDRWTFTVNVVKPDGTNDTLGPFKSDPVGDCYTTYVPTEVGNYTVQAYFPGDKLTGLPTQNGLPPTAVNVNDTYLPSVSAPLTFTVTQQPLAPWSEAPLPTNYWTVPINGANRNWYTLAGNWLAGAAQNVGPTTVFGYGTGPESAHVMWTTPEWNGGIMDARFNDVSYTLSHYEGITFTPPIILNGYIYYNVKTDPHEGWYCISLYDGKTAYFENTTGPVTGVSSSSSGSIAGGSLAFGQILQIINPNQKGGFPYLWSTTPPSPLTNTWMMYDAYTGNYICSIANVTQTVTTPDKRTVTTGATGSSVYGADGSILRYNIVNLGTTAAPQDYLQVWNTTQAIWWKGTEAMYFAGDMSGFAANSYWMWRPGSNVTYDGNNGFTLNASIPAVQGSILAVRENQYVIGGTAGSNNEQGVTQGNLWALNLKEVNGQITPTLLWNITFTPPSSAGNKTITMGTVDPEDGVFLFQCGQTMQRWGYSLATGQPLWGPTANEPAYNDLNFYTLTNIYEGMLLTEGLGGVLIAYNITTGQQMWNYTATQVGFESPYGNYPLCISCIADGKIYLGATFWGTNPPWRDFIRCVNASNGVLLWQMLCCDRTSGIAGQLYVSDGYLVGFNYYDNSIYCWGKGPSDTKVEAPLNAIAEGSSAIIQGTVMDTSPGTTQLAQAADFPNGVPAVSDASVESWMEYVYEQQAMPTNATGVPVSLDAIDPNGNYIHIGNATSDLRGIFSYAWMPPNVPGKYTIITTFAGSNSYWPSSAETNVVVSAAPATPAPTAVPLNESTLESSLMSYVVIASIAIIIAIAIVGLLLLRKRP